MRRRSAGSTTSRSGTAAGCCGERYRKHVRFFEANLHTASSVGRPPYDVVLCRNLLVSFDDAGFNRAVSVWHTSHPGRYLLLGHSESLIDRSEEFIPV